MFHQSEQFPNEMHFYVALLDQPAYIEPTTHFHADELLPWIRLSDNLPRQLEKRALSGEWFAAHIS